MRSLFSVLLVALAMSACSSQRIASDAVLNERVVLILSPQGSDPARDTVGFNNLSRRVTQAFSSDLLPRLGQHGKTAVNVIDQGTEYNVGQKLAMYSVRERAKTAIVLTLETDTVEGDERLSLRAQWVDQRPIVENGSMRGVTAVSTVERSYVLRGSRSGDNPKSMSDLASNFIDAMKSQGKL